MNSVLANATDISTSLKANAGVVGDMILKPKGGVLSDQRIRVSIRLADEKTIGRLTLGQGWRTEKWHNISPYPITLKHLHVLWVNGNTPAVYTWLLGDKEIPPRSQVQFRGEAVPQWLDNEPYARFWLDYEIEQCDSCHDSVIRSVIHSTVQSQAGQLATSLAEGETPEAPPETDEAQLDALGPPLAELEDDEDGLEMPPISEILRDIPAPDPRVAQAPASSRVQAAPPAPPVVRRPPIEALRSDAVAQTPQPPVIPATPDTRGTGSQSTCRPGARRGTFLGRRSSRTASRAMSGSGLKITPTPRSGVKPKQW